MNFLDYIKGNRKGADAHRIEKDSMTDPFMYEAIEGFDSVDDNHIERINRIHKRLNLKDRMGESKRRNYHMWQLSAACAVAVVIFSVVGYFYKDTLQTSMYAENVETISSEDVLKIYVPQDYYSENVVVIAKHNIESIKTYKSDIGKLEVKAKEKYTEEIDITPPKEVLDVYIPE